MRPPPSGAQHRLASGDQEVTVVEVGGGLRSYTVGGVPVLDGYRAEEMADGGRGQHLLPWPNRIAGGRYAFGRDDFQLPLTEPAHGHAIHGLVRWSSWMATAREPERLVMEHVLHPQPGYPFTLGLAVEYRLGPGGLSVATTATNLDDRPCPYGAGSHPYLTAGTDVVDDALLQVPADLYLETDGRGVPTGTAPVEGTAYDFRVARSIGDLVLDTAYTGLTGNDAIVAGAGGLRRVSLWWDQSYRWLMVFTGDTLAPARRRRSVALEPMTCAPNAFVTGDGLRILEPGEAWTTTWGLSPAPGH